MLEPHDQWEGVRPENELEQEDARSSATRWKALFLLLAFLLPSLGLLFELLTGRLSLFWQETIQPTLPQFLDILHF